MKYSIIGSGAIGSKIAGQFARISTDVAVANKSGPASLSGLVSELGEHIIPTELSDALSTEIVILAVPFEAMQSVLEGARPWDGRVIVDVSNAMNYKDFSPLDLGGRPSIDVVGDLAPGARLVKGFNHNWPRVLGRNPVDTRGGRHVLFVSGNDPQANAAVAEMMSVMGFAPVDLGRTDEGGRLSQFGGPLTTISLVTQLQGGASFAEMDLINP